MGNISAGRSNSGESGIFLLKYILSILFLFSSFLAPNVSFAEPPLPPQLAGPGEIHPWIRITWTDTDNETSYIVERKTGADGVYTQIALLPADTTSFIDLYLAPSTVYFYRVRATNSTGDSSASNEASAVTEARQGRVAANYSLS